MSGDEDFEDEIYEDFDEIAEESPSLNVKEIFASPIVKIGAVILVLCGITLGYLMMPKEKQEDSTIVLRVGAGTGVTYIPGQEDLDPAFKKALEETNVKEAERAERVGGSALPMPVGRDRDSTAIDAEKVANDGGGDSLEEWRRSSSRRRAGARSMSDGDYGSGSNVDCVPDLDQCMDLLKKSGMLTDLCKEHLASEGLLDEMCAGILAKDGLSTDMKVKQCKQLLEDSGVLGADGRIIDGTLFADNENMTDASAALRGNLGKAGNNTLGYDANGNVVTYKDGDVIRDRFGNAVLDENGNPILYKDGKYLTDANGNLVLDAEGRPLALNNTKDGKCVDDGYLRDANCNLILGPDGKPILKNGANDGHLRDANGNLILGADGKPVLLNSGKDGKCVDDGYLRDANCNLILGPDGKPILKNGMVDGKCIEDEYLRDENCNLILGPDGKPLLKNGMVDGKCIEDGYLRDENCNLILGPDGKPILKSSLGAGTGADSLAGLGSGLGAAGARGGRDGSVSFVDPNKAGAMSGGAGGMGMTVATPEEVQALSQQMMAILQTKVPEAMKQSIITARPSLYQEMLEEEAKAGGKRKSRSRETIGADGSVVTEEIDEEALAKQALAMPGEMFYAQMITEVNSDVPNVVLAQILTGPFAGGRAVGGFSLNEEHLLLQFTSIIKDDVTYPIEAVALDQKTSLPGMATDVSRHYFTRVFFPFAAKFIENYSAAKAETGVASKVTDTGTETIEKPAPTARQAFWAGVEEATGVIVDDIDSRATPPVTVRIRKGTTFGLLMLSKVTVGSAK